MLIGMIGFPLSAYAKVANESAYVNEIQNQETNISNPDSESDDHVKTDLSHSTTADAGKPEHDDIAYGEISTPTEFVEPGELSAQDNPESLATDSSANISPDESEQNESEETTVIESNVD